MENCTDTLLIVEPDGIPLIVIGEDCAVPGLPPENATVVVVDPIAGPAVPPAAVNKFVPVPAVTVRLDGDTTGVKGDTL